MPTYEYKCESCGQVFELRQKFSDRPLDTHDACGGKVHRLISAPALQFKGSGWYVTDYAKGGSSAGASSPPANGDSAKADKAEKPAKTETSSPAASTGKSDKKD